jgi:hypothetical protein
VEQIVMLIALEVWAKSRGAANPPLLDDESDDLCTKLGEISFGELDLALCDPLGGSALR